MATQKISVEAFSYEATQQSNGLERNNSFKCMFTQYVENVIKQLDNCYLSIDKKD